MIFFASLIFEELNTSLFVPEAVYTRVGVGKLSIFWSEKPSVMPHRKIIGKSTNFCQKLIRKK